MTKNKLKNVKVGGNYTGGDDNSENTHVHLDDVAINALTDKNHIDKFSLNAQRHIANIAEKILQKHDVNLKNQGLDFSKLQEKFENVKCTEDYKNSHRKQAVYFHEIDQIRKNDSVEGGDLTIQGIMVLITNIYNHFFEKYDTGDMIHKAIFGQIIGEESKAVDIIATDVLIHYTVDQCGIFNEKK